MKKTNLFILVMFICSLSFSQTHVSGTIDGETWNIEGSPYIMVGNLFIASLVLEPGVTVMADGDYEIEIAGIITAVGTEQDSIVFTTTDSITGWQGILFNVTTFASKLQYCKIEHSINSGIRIINSTPIIENCSLLNNSASQGGAIYFFNDTEVGSVFTLCDCSFSSNISTGHAGALFVSLEEGHIILDHSHFGNNRSNPSQSTGNFVGGALYLVTGDATILNSSFIGNRSDSRCTNDFGCNVTARGGAIYIGSSGNIVIENSIFLENRTHAKNDGNCFFGGTSNSYGGGVFVNTGTVSLSNNIFAYNLTTRTNCNPSDGGGGVYANGGVVTLCNESVAYNSDATGVHCAGGTLDIKNSIIYFNNGEETQIGGSCSVTFSNVQDGFSGEGNISNNPVFVEGDSALHLTSISPCIDAGNPEELYNDVCFPPSLGEIRNDMGAYGGPVACSWLNITSDMTDILSYSFAEQTGLADIDKVAHTVVVEVEYGTNVSNLVATFYLCCGATASVGGVDQVSGVTANDFTNPVTYVVTAEDELTVQDWLVTVDIVTGINDYEAANVNIYPNPTYDYVNVDLQSNMNISYIEIIDMQGIVVKRKEVATYQNTIDVRDLSCGVYIIRLQTDKGVAMKKLIIN